MSTCARVIKPGTVELLLTGHRAAGPAPTGTKETALAGAVVTLRKEKGSKTTRVANGGNALFAALKLKMLLDYRDRFITFYGACR